MNQHVVHENVADGNNMIGFPFVIAYLERDMPGIKPGPMEGGLICQKWG